MKQRGKFLTVMIVLAILGYFQSLFYVFSTDALKQVYGTVPVWYPLYLLVSLGIGATSIVGIWKMKKWGVYVLGFSVLVSLIVQSLVLKPTVYPEFTLYLTLSSAGIWALAIYRKWANFN